LNAKNLVSSPQADQERILIYEEGYGKNLKVKARSLRRFLSRVGILDDLLRGI
jgi:hypothetical protein